jgi:branched-chain amino acid transport system permease protein
VYSISRLPNFAHGALYITAGYVIWLLLNGLGLSYPLAIMLGIGFASLIGVLMYRLILIRIRGMEISEIIATYAIGLAIIEGLRWGGLRGTTFTLPSFASGSRDILGVSVDDQRILVVVVGFAVFALLYLFVHFTRNGLALRGIAQDERAALAGLSAALILPLGNIVVEAGYSVLVFAIAVSVIGGLGSWAGAIIASFLIGFAQILTEKFLSAHFQMVIALMAIIITLLIKPSGILGRQKELEERV